MSRGGSITLSMPGSFDLLTANAAVKRGAAKGLGLAAEHVLTVANTMVPLEEGTLMRSGQTRVLAEQLVAAVFYDTPYAVRQHEDMTLAHDGGRTAKYLERALTQERDTCAQIIAQAIRAELGG